MRPGEIGEPSARLLCICTCVVPSLSAARSLCVNMPSTPGIYCAVAVIEPRDLRMRVRRAQDHRIGLARNIHVVDEPPAALQQARVLEAAHR